MAEVAQDPRSRGRTYSTEADCRRSLPGSSASGCRGVHNCIALSSAPQGSYAQPCRPGIEGGELDAVTLLVRLTAIEQRTFNSEMIDNQAGSDHAKTGVRRVLQVMRERGRGQLRR